MSDIRSHHDRKGWQPGMDIAEMCEVETFLQRCPRLEYVDTKQVLQIIDSLSAEGRMLRGLQKSLSARLNP